MSFFDREGTRVCFRLLPWEGCWEWGLGGVEGISVGPSGETG